MVPVIVPVIVLLVAQHFWKVSGKAIDQKEYRDVGACIALSIIHGGPGPSIMSEGLYNELIGTPTTPKLESITDQNVKNQLSKIKNANDVDAARKEILESMDLLSLLGTNRYVKSLEDRDRLVTDAVRFYLFGRMHAAIDQLKDGMNSGRILLMLKKDPEGFRHLFTATGDTTLGVMLVQNLFKPRFSTKDSNKRRKENRIIAYWRDWLIEIADGESEITMVMLLVFATGARRIPPLGFPFHPCLEFLEADDSSYPTSNTCSLVLRLPLHDTYAQWKSMMESGIIQSPTFRVN